LHVFMALLLTPLWPPVQTVPRHQRRGARLKGAMQSARPWREKDPSYTGCCGFSDSLESLGFLQ